MEKHLLYEASLIKNDTTVRERLRKEYPVGTRVELVRMSDPQAPPVGTKGTVKGVDAIASLLVSWDNSSSLNVLYGEDECKKIVEESEERSWKKDTNHERFRVLRVFCPFGEINLYCEIQYRTNGRIEIVTESKVLTESVLLEKKWTEEIRTLKKSAYEKYIALWMERISEQRIQEAKSTYEELQSIAYVENYTFEDYISENGYQGELYVCFNEFLDCEYCDEEFMKCILSKEEWELYSMEKK